MTLTYSGSSARATTYTPLVVALASQEIKKRRVEEGRRADAKGRGSGARAGASGEGEHEDEAKRSKASFLDKMRGEQMDSMGLEERMQRNRHYQQRGADVHNFMARG